MVMTGKRGTSIVAQPVQKMIRRTKKVATVKIISKIHYGLNATVVRNGFILTVWDLQDLEKIMLD